MPLGPAVQGGNLQRSDEVGTSVRHRADDEELVDLREYWNILVRCKVTITVLLAVAMVIAVLATFLETPIFRAETLIQINLEED